MQDIALGDIVCLPGENFVELGLAIKQASPFKTRLVVELSNAVERCTCRPEPPTPAAATRSPTPPSKLGRGDGGRGCDKVLRELHFAICSVVTFCSGNLTVVCLTRSSVCLAGRSLATLLVIVLPRGRR